MWPSPRRCLQRGRVGCRKEEERPHSYIHICIYVYMYICIYVYMYICIYVYMYICIYVYVYMCICVYVYICIYVYVYMCIHIYVYGIHIKEEICFLCGLFRLCILLSLRVPPSLPLLCFALCFPFREREKFDEASRWQ